MNAGHAKTVRRFLLRRLRDIAGSCLTPWLISGSNMVADSNKGLFWICDPEPIMPVLHVLFASDPEFDAGKMVPFMRDAFGEVSVWHPKFKLITLNMNRGTVTTTDITTQVIEGVPPLDDDMAVASAVDASVFDGHGWVDARTGKPVRCRAQTARADRCRSSVYHGPTFPPRRYSVAVERGIPPRGCGGYPGLRLPRWCCYSLGGGRLASLRSRYAAGASSRLPDRC
ncbi:GAD-like domain-containing protein [Rhizobium aethiopicum]|uniref:GAD-like domain-containing protein n=1 Tax=Rhizobium aethiopicum TaxID=1138170 RepID=A0A1C3Y3D9_9HYPH|nr:GAD-like domain-containing protein [Rhizobium aethiopicum]